MKPANYFSSVSQLEQRTLAKFMEQGFWERHIRRMRGIYKKKHQAILRAIDEHFDTRAVVEWQGAGLHVVMQLPDATCSETEIINRAQKKGLQLFPFSWTCATPEEGNTRLMLGFGGMTPAEINEGIALLSRCT